ncbi:MAG: flagellar protein FlaG [Bryobacterales bacterium]|nr:flagellar protein FlaG [Bryobacteraceae bacterium]MDW8131983.1 flagellar protein FlaG [Bryobacterales bacterium]MDW8355273.1 flagellar protein FlaG [Bryobacterales bacterium]
MEITALHRPAPVQSAAGQPVAPEQAAQNRELIQAVKALNAAELFGQDRELTFAVDRETQRTVIRVVDRKTRDVIQQIPPEHVLELAREHRRGRE